MIGYWNDEEDAALQGLSLEAQIIYLRGIRRFADRNGVAGIERRINWASLCEACHFVPDVGSKKPASKPTRDMVKHRLSELERAGLIVRRENLVFELPLAVMDRSIQMRTAQGRHKDGTSMTARMTAQSKPLQHNDSDFHDGTYGVTMTAQGRHMEDGHTSPITIKTPLPPLEEDEIPSGWKADSRTMKPMSLDWTPDSNTLNTYLQGKAANGRPVTAADVQSWLPDWRQSANASGKTMTDAQWTLRLVKYVMACMTSDGATPTNRRASAPQEDPLAFSEENRPERGPYALFKPGPKKTPMTDEGRARVDQLRRQAFGDAA